MVINNPNEVTTQRPLGKNLNLGLNYIYEN